jgi:hypothetical protein
MDHAFIVKKAGDIDMVSTGTQITVNNEIMVYQSYDEETGLLTVKRGALDTFLRITWLAVCCILQMILSR